MKAIQKLKLTNLPSLLKSSEAADLLRIDIQTLRRWAHKGRIPFYKIDVHRWRYKREDVLAILKQETV